MICEINTAQMCSHLRRKLMDDSGAYHALWVTLQSDNELTYSLRQRQLHIARNGKKVLVLAGKAAPKIFNNSDPIIRLL